MSFPNARYREHPTDFCDRTAEQQQEVTRQAARNQEIFQSWLENITYARQQDFPVVPDCAAHGFTRVLDICSDIKDSDDFVSRTACRSLLELAHWCFDHMNDAAGTVRPREYNSIKDAAEGPSLESQGEEFWMALRGQRLICDLHDLSWMRLLFSARPRLRRFCATALRWVEFRCFAEETASASLRDSAGRSFWAECGNSAYRVLGAETDNTDSFVSGAAMSVQGDAILREMWRTYYIVLPSVTWTFLVHCYETGQWS